MMFRRGQVRLAAVVLLGASVISGSAAPSSRPGYGAIPYADAAGTGVTFRVWAPYATSIQALGDFNGWQYGTQLSKEPGTENWSLDVPGAAAGQEYKYVINGNLWRKDPRSRRVTGGNNSVIYDPGAFNWSGDSFTPPAKNDTVIYELHVGTFCDPVTNDYSAATFENAIARLDYLAELGVNCIELMPIHSFPGDRSWGYNPVDIYAVENAYGGPDLFKSFVKACHQKGMAVMLDVVHNHYDAQNPDCHLWEFDGWWGYDNYGGIYFYQEDGKCCTIWGRRPDYSRAAVRSFITNNIGMWLDEYRVDGFRWDSPINIKYYDGTFNPEGYNLVWSLNEWIRDNYLGHLSIGEDESQDMNFDSEWHDSFHGSVVGELTKSSDAERNIWTLRDAVNSGAGLYRVIYVESHDKVGKLNNAQRLVTKIDPANPTGYWARTRAALGAAMAFTSPGIPMLFMGQEWFEEEWFDDFDPLDWNRSEARMRSRLLFQHLIRLRRNLDGTTAGLKGSSVNILHANDGAKVLAWHRWNSHGTNDDVVVAANFSVTSWGDYNIPFPYAGTWYCQFDSDWSLYDTNYGDYGRASVIVPSDGANASIKLAPYSVVVFSRSTPPPRDADQDAILDSWEAANGLSASDPSDAAGDPDVDGLSSLREFELGTDPQVYNALSGFTNMAVAGTINGWSTTANPMKLTTHYTWELLRRVAVTSFEYKCVADGSWATSWGDTNQADRALPLSGTGDPGGDKPSIQVTNAAGTPTIRFVFVETGLLYSAEAAAATDADADGMNDAWEVFYGLSAASNDAAGNADADAFSNLQEFLNGSSPVDYTAPLHDYETMSLAGTFNNWSLTRASMRLFEDYGWQAILNLDGESGVLFKFAANGGWAANWGDNSQGDTSVPISEYGDWLGGNLSAAGTLDGVYRFRFNNQSLLVQVDLLPALDADADGVHDDWETLHGFDPADSADGADDPDNDGMSNFIEFDYGSDPHHADPVRANYSGMNLAGSFNAWSSTSQPMALVEHFTWQTTLAFTNTGAITFKFAADGSWAENWGDNTAPTSAPFIGVGDSYGSNIAMTVDRAGDYRFTFNDRTLQYVFEFLPRAAFESVNVPGTFNGWDPTAYPMQLVDNNTWMLETVFGGLTNTSFKFVGNRDWDQNWGETNQVRTAVPMFGVGDAFGANVAVSDKLNGRYRFTFNDLTHEYGLVVLSQPDFDGDGMPDDWETRYNLNPSNAADAVQHADSDGMNNLEEYRAGTHPGLDSSVLLLDVCEPLAGQSLRLGWSGGEDAWQYLLRAGSLTDSAWTVVCTNTPPTAVETTFTNPLDGARGFYRIRASRLPP